LTDRSTPQAKDLSVDLYDYYLPASDIAQYPCDRRDASRLLILDRGRPPGDPGGMRHRHFCHLLGFLRPDDCLVINETRVMPARLRGFKVPSGGMSEVFLVEPHGDGTWTALLRPGRRLPPGTEVAVFSSNLVQELASLPPAERLKEAGPEGAVVRVEERAQQGAFIVSVACADPEQLERLGDLPLPPYISRGLEDPARYQTVYADHPGSVAAPTAGLHFTPDLLKAASNMDVKVARLVLHIGLGTFQPVREDDIRKHEMHEEYLEVDSETVRAVQQAQARGGRIIAVGTTVVRALETATACGQLRPYRGRTDLFIYPGYRFKTVDMMITNFHLPRSTLLMLVSAFAGRDRIMAAYREARRRAYRFYSFGDAMLIL